jgi:HK97 family phage major capsid protein
MTREQKEEKTYRLIELFSEIRKERDEDRRAELRAEYDNINASLQSEERKERWNSGGKRDYSPSWGSDSEYRKAFDRYVRFGDTSGVAEYRVSTGLTTAPNNSQTGSENAGYEVAQEFWQNLQIALKAYGGLASHYRQVSTDTGAPMPWPTLDPTGVSATVLGQELTQLSTSSPYVFGQGVAGAWTIATSPILVSLQLVNDSQFSVDDLLTRVIGEQIGRKIAVDAYSGNGTSTLQGINTVLNARGSVGTVGGAIASTGGFVTLAAAASVKTFAAPAGATELVGNVLGAPTLLAMMQAVDPAYWSSAAWFFNPTQLWNLRGVIDSNGRPLLNFNNGFDGVEGQPETYAMNRGDTELSASEVNVPIARLFGFPVYADPAISNLTASTCGGPIFGSLSHAMMQRTVHGTQGGASILRLDQRWADQLAIGYIGFVRTDVRANDLRAAVTVKPAAT